MDSEHFFLVVNLHFSVLSWEFPMTSSPWPFTMTSPSAIHIQHPGRQRPWPLPWRCWMGRWKGRRWGRWWSRGNAWERSGRKMHDAMMIHDAMMPLDCVCFSWGNSWGIPILYFIDIVHLFVYLGIWWWRWRMMNHGSVGILNGHN